MIVVEALPLLIVRSIVLPVTTSEVAFPSVMAPLEVVSVRAEPEPPNVTSPFNLIIPVLVEIAPAVQLSEPSTVKAPLVLEAADKLCPKSNVPVVVNVTGSLKVKSD